MKGKKILAGALSASMVLGTVGLPVFAEGNLNVNNGVVSTSNVSVSYTTYEVGTGCTYANLNEAFAAANTAGVEAAEFKIFGEVKIDGEGWLLDSMPNVKHVKFVGTDTNDKIVIEKAKAVLGTSVSTCKIETVEFSDLTLSHPNGSWQNDFAHSTNYFTTWLRGAGTNGSVSYTRCVFPDGASNNQYGSTSYTECTFKGNSSTYGLWIYYADGDASKVNVFGCGFSGAKGVKLYSEGAAGNGKTEISSSTFDKISDKPAIVCSTGGTVELNNITTNDCPYGLVAMNSEGRGNGQKNSLATIDVDGKPAKFEVKYGDLRSSLAYAKAEYEGAGVTESDLTANVAQIGEETYATLDAAITDAKDGETVKLSQDAVVNKQVEIKSDITLDLNGKNITASDEFTTAFRVLANVTVDDSSAEKNGSIDVADKGNYCFIVGKEVVENQVVTGTKNGTLTINNGTFNGDTSVVSVTSGTANINGGSYSVKPYNGEYKYLLNCVDKYYRSGDAKIVVTGGQFANFNPFDNGAEGAGTSFGAPGYAASADTNGNYTVTPVTTPSTGDVVQLAKDGAVVGCYTSLQDAINAAEDGSTITLLKDITIECDTKGYVYYATIDGKKLTIDLNEKKIEWDIKYDNPNDNDWDIVFEVKNGADVTITGNGKVDCDFGTGSHGSLAFVKGLSKLTIENGEYTSDDNIVFIYAAYTNRPDGGVTVVNGGKFSSSRLPNGNIWLLNVGGSAMSANKKFVVNGGTFVDYDPRHTNDGNKLASGYTVSKKGNDYTVISESDVVATATHTTITTSNNQTVTTVRTYGYTSLAEAVANAAEGDTVTLLKDMKGDGFDVSKDITIDFGGYKYEVDSMVGSSTATQHNGIRFLRDEQNNTKNVTLKNGTLTSTVATNLIQNYANLTLVNMNIDGTNLPIIRNSKPYTVSHSNGALTIDKDTTIIGSANGYAFDVSEWGGYTGATAKVEAGAYISGLVQLKNYDENAAFGGKLTDGNNVEYTEQGDYVQQGNGFAKYVERKISTEASETEVKAGEEFTVTVNLNATNINFVEYTMTYDKDLFELVGASEQTGVIENTLLPTDTPYSGGIATYTFKAKAQAAETTGAFAVTSAEALTYEEGLRGEKPATTIGTAAEVTIKLAEISVVTKLNDEVVTVGENTVINKDYDGTSYTFTVVPTPADAVKSTSVKYFKDGQEVTEMKEAGTYTIKYEVKGKDGYSDVSGELKLVIGEPKFYVEVNLGDTITNSAANFTGDKKIVLVYTDQDNLFWTYDNNAMVEVTMNNYKYVGSETTQDTFKHVYAFVTKAVENATLDTYKAKVNYTSATRDGKNFLINPYGYDVNFMNGIENGDIVTVYGVYNNVNSYFKDVAEQKKLLKSDINGDKVVDGTDTGLVVNAVKKTKAETNDKN